MVDENRFKQDFTKVVAWKGPCYAIFSSSVTLLHKVRNREIGEIKVSRKTACYPTFYRNVHEIAKLKCLKI